MTQQPLGGDSLLIIEASLSHSETPHTVGLLWTSDRPVAKELPPTTHNTHMRQTSMATARFEPPTPAIERPQTHALERAATEIGSKNAILSQTTNIPSCTADKWLGFLLFLLV